MGSTNNTLNRRNVAVGCLVILTIYLAAVIWPVPRYFSRGIPSSSTNIEAPVARHMISGDHLQINYFYWIFGSMLKGETPFLYNIYEFNTGDDEQRYSPGGYNVPYSLVYALGLLSGNRPFAWNLMLTAMALLSGVLFYLYMRQLLASRALALALACVHIGFPYRWISAMGGSPTGISMVCVPLLALGVHLFVAKHQWRGYLLALVALLTVHANEHHVFLFGVLTLPLPSLIAIFHGRDCLLDRTWREWRGVALRLMALMAIIGGMGLHMLVGMGEALEGTTVASGRTLKEVAGFSPQPVGLFSWLENGINGHAFIGIGAILFLALFGLCAVLRARQMGIKAFLADPAFLLPALLWVFLVGAACLSLGTNGPFDALVLLIVRKVIPGMDLIRQPAKINCVVAFFLPVAAALSLMGQDKVRKLVSVGAVVLAILLAVEYVPQVRPTVCLLPPEQGAYKAVRVDAEAHGEEPRAVVLPLWPGDSAWASLYEYYTSLHRIRMVNGYRPVVPPEYYDDVFATLGGLNCGALDADVVRALRSMKIDYILFHEDAFPEKVCPFPVGFALDRLVASGFVDLLERDGSIWAFRVKDLPAVPIEPLVAREYGPMISFPSRFWDMAHQLAEGGERIVVDGVGRAAVMTPGSRALLPYVNAWGADKAAVTVYAKGQGTIRVELDEYERDVTIDTADWQWVDLPLPAQPLGGEMAISGIVGEVMLSTGFLAAGPWRDLILKDAFELPASWFYHAGHMDAACSGVSFRRDWEPDDRIWYGFGLPLASGRYQFRLDYVSDAPAGVVLGSFRCERGEDVTSADVVAGDSSVSCTLDVRAGELPRLSFRYTRQGDLKLLRVVATRVGGREA